MTEKKTYQPTKKRADRMNVIQSFVTSQKDPAAAAAAGHVNAAAGLIDQTQDMRMKVSIEVRKEVVYSVRVAHAFFNKVLR